MEIKSYIDNRLSWFRPVVLLGVCLVMLVPGFGFSYDTGLSETMDELSIIMEDDKGWPKRPLEKIGAAIIWEGPVETDGEYIYFAGIGARIIFSGEEAEFPETRFIGFGGEEVTLEEMDLSAVHVNIGLTSDDAHVVKWMVQGPVLILRGRITELAPEYETLTVKDFDIAVTENTRLKKLRIFYPNKPIEFSDPAVGMPVRVVAHDVDSVYLGLGVLVVIPPYPDEYGIYEP